MYEILEDGRVALDPTAPNDKIALSVYADLLRNDQDKLDSPMEIDSVLAHTRVPGRYHIHTKEDMGDLNSLGTFFVDNGYRLVKLVVEKVDEVESA